MTEPAQGAFFFKKSVQYMNCVFKNLICIMAFQQSKTARLLALQVEELPSTWWMTEAPIPTHPLFSIFLVWHHQFPFYWVPWDSLIWRGNEKHSFYGPIYDVFILIRPFSTLSCSYYQTNASSLWPVCMVDKPEVEHMDVFCCMRI